MLIDGKTRVVGILGGPGQVSESYSPLIHNAAFESLGLNWVYVPFGVEVKQLAECVSGLGAAGVAGFNVTTPHKVAVLDHLASLSDAAREIGAVNVVRGTPSGWEGFNTDGPGLVRFLHSMDVGVSGARVLVLGAGGAARAAVYELAQRGATSVTVAARDPLRAMALSHLAGNSRFAAEGLPPSGGYDLVINALPPEALASLPLSTVSAGTTFLDMTYWSATTALMEAADRAGARAFNGLGMLVHQAALSFEVWTGREAPLEAMEAAALAASRSSTEGGVPNRTQGRDWSFDDFGFPGGSKR